MAVFSTIQLSGSTNGRPIPVISTASPGTTLHTVSTATAIRDFPYIWLSNLATANRQVTFEWGGTTTQDQIIFTVPAQDGLYAMTPGPMLVGATNIVVRAFGTATFGLNAVGYVDRAT